jgi:methionyl-tRNA synthetase
MLCERIQIREDLKMRSAHLQLLTFAQECKQYFEMQHPEELPHSDTKERVRTARLSTEAFKRRR